VSKSNDFVLSENGENLSSVLLRLEKNDEIRENIIDLMSLIVPQIEDITIKKDNLQGANYLYIKETLKEFPANMVSEGTIYILSLLAIILDVNKDSIKLSLIEEPERGLHPQAIRELVQLMREYADEHGLVNSIWLSTHNTTLVRACKPEELIFIENVDGETIAKKPLIEPPTSLPLDEAWLSNSLDGGLPW
jgi:predicted ATPase